MENVLNVDLHGGYTQMCTKVKICVAAHSQLVRLTRYTLCTFSSLNNLPSCDPEGPLQETPTYQDARRTPATLICLTDDTAWFSALSIAQERARMVQTAVASGM